MTITQGIQSAPSGRDPERGSSPGDDRERTPPPVVASAIVLLVVLGATILALAWYPGLRLRALGRLVPGWPWW